VIDMAFPSLSVRAKTAQVMQFQAQLLKELALSPDTATQWRGQVKNILNEAAGVIDARFAFTFFEGGNEKFSLEYFWSRDSPSAARENAERQVKRELSESGVFAKIPEYAVIHSYLDIGPPKGKNAADRVEIHTRALQFPTARQKGLVGIGLGSAQRSPAETTAIDCTLTAVSNIVGSVNALLAYTRILERFATRDPLTGLYNQTSFWDLLEYEKNRSLRQEYKFSLLVLDLDNFKTINDAYGHETGDSFLVHFSRILKKAVRSGDIAARHHGDQFSAILPVCDEGQAMIVAKRIIEDLRQFSLPLENGRKLTGTVSVGAAVFPDHTREAKDLYLLADNMLARSKAFGKDRLSIPSEQDDIETIKRMGVKNILVLEALSKHQIVPYFQPIMNVRNANIDAYEVLTRIILPNRRVVPAAEFIKTAEGMGAIGRIDYQLFENALARVRESRYPGSLFINLSPVAMVMDEFLPTVRKLLRDYSVEPGKLIFEITEQNTSRNAKEIDTFILELKSEGFRFAIDNFGSGYSSLRQIKTSGIDYLKIDGSLIRHMGGDGDSVEKEIVASIASLAERLGIKSIAENVESKEILSEVDSVGIDYAQGYYIQEPSPDLF
jgi:diguanylate cyclase (GGDEF)-like protein